MHTSLWPPSCPRDVVFGVQSRWAAFNTAWKDVAKIYVIVVTLLAAGAIWEMTGLFLTLHPQLNST